MDHYQAERLKHLESELIGESNSTPTELYLDVLEKNEPGNLRYRKSHPLPIAEGFGTTEKGVNNNVLGPTGNKYFRLMIFLYENHMRKTKDLFLHAIFNFVLCSVSFFMMVFSAIFSFRYQNTAWTYLSYRVELFDDFFRWNSGAGDFERSSKSLGCIWVGLMLMAIYGFSFVAYIIQGLFLMSDHQNISGRKNTFANDIKAYLGSNPPVRLPADEWYFAILRDSGVNIFRFVHFSITTGLYTWIIAMVFGIVNVMLIVFIWISIISFYFGWMLTEAEFNISAMIEFFKHSEPFKKWDSTKKKAIVEEYYKSEKLSADATGMIAKIDLATFPALEGVDDADKSGVITAVFEGIVSYLAHKGSHDKIHGKMKWVSFGFTILFGLVTWLILAIYFGTTANSQNSEYPWVAWTTFFVSTVFYIVVFSLFIARLKTRVLRENVFLYETLIHIFDFSMKFIITICILVAGKTADGIGTC